MLCHVALDADHLCLHSSFDRILHIPSSASRWRCSESCCEPGDRQPNRPCCGSCSCAGFSGAFVCLHHLGERASPGNKFKLLVCLSSLGAWGETRLGASRFGERTHSLRLLPKRASHWSQGRWIASRRCGVQFLGLGPGWTRFESAVVAVSRLLPCHRPLRYWVSIRGNLRGAGGPLVSVCHGTNVV